MYCSFFATTCGEIKLCVIIGDNLISRCAIDCRSVPSFPSIDFRPCSIFVSSTLVNVHTKDIVYTCEGVHLY